MTTAEPTSLTEESGSTPVEPASATSKAKPSPREFLAPARRNLSEDELSAPGVRRFLIEEIQKLDDRCAAMDVLAEKYNDLRVEKAVLEVQLKSSKWHEVLSGLCLAVGSAGIAIGLRLIDVPAARDTGVVLLIVSAVLVVAGIASKVWK